MGREAKRSWVPSAFDASTEDVFERASGCRRRCLMTEGNCVLVVSLDLLWPVQI